MEAKLNLDTQELAKEISQEVIKAIRTLIAREPEGEEVWSVKETAEYLGMSADWVYKQVGLKTIPHYKVGDKPKFKKSQIEKWLNSNMIQPVSPIKSVLNKKRWPAD
jgi:excisionase family DNA binding protein